MKYFSVDYRSPPSGIGQIVNTDFPPTPDHMILISYNGCGIPNDPKYGHTIYIDTPEIEDQGWIGPELPFLFQLLKSLGIEKVHDPELGFEHPELSDSDFQFDLQDWIDIVNRYC